MQQPSQVEPFLHLLAEDNGREHSLLWQHSSMQRFGLYESAIFGFTFLGVLCFPYA